MPAESVTPQLIVDLTPTLQGFGGIGRYAAELAGALAAGGTPGLRLFTVDRAGRPAPGSLAALPMTQRRQAARAWRFEIALSGWIGRDLDAAVGARPGDVFHATDHVLPPLSRRVRSVFTLHDLSYLDVPETHSSPNRTYLKWMMPRFLRRADVVVAVSESTRRRAISTYGLVPERIRTVHHGVGAQFHPAPPAEIERVRARYALPARYVLCVGTLEPRKNLVTARAAFAAAGLAGVALVHAGPRGWLHDEAIGPDPAAGAVMHFAGPVGDADLPALYSGAEAFLFPSLYEGFGFPVLEAMACGTPVLSSDTTSLPEIVGDAGVLLPPRDVAAWTAALRAIAGEPGRERRQELAARGRARAARFTWDATARAMRVIYEELHAPRP